MDLCNINEIQVLLRRHGFHFSKRMGQNFLIDADVPRVIAEASGAAEASGVLEIGPGIGALTVQLAQRAQRVTAVELDRALLPVLDETLAPYQNVAVLSGDILKMNLPTLVAEHFAGLCPLVCANLPYNITTPVLTALLESGCFQRITVMVQREVALRICAAPGTSDYGSFSIFCRYHALPELLFDVPPDAFLPVPRVFSSVLQLTPRSAPPAEVENPALFFQVVRASFAQRRKTLLNGLSAAFGSRVDKATLRQILQALSLPQDIRGERLGIPEFAALSAMLAAHLR
ncbi:MAG: 16S rRNA (adenine(1518)-N(6)/adenine(1519)-N(6))-dimethyltransferase RsmA [Oscillospiraceae bacterium]|nr:16S rRNA (adenine(1518)-N(6)/adenine(1519)-N(6))-dimethyltransferase RsmA [Oscillospiraceae bacterium]